MTEQSPPPPENAADRDPDGDADRRMAEVLRGTSSAATLRQELLRQESEHAMDLLARLDALEFVNQVVGSATDVPERLGGYEIKGLLGRGGMGTVYLGWQRELEREVALKVLSPHFAQDPTMRKRFRIEARATAALHHRHIVPIYDYGEADGMLFFAMERVDGMSLDKHIAAARRAKLRPLEPLAAARRFAGVADALGLAHRRLMLHRDVKPGNILVGRDGTMALTDFGLAKALDRVSALTSGGGFLGTLHYASPEQALGRDLTPASDLYSLGVTMFESVTGELPLQGKTTEALLQAILQGTPRRIRDFVPHPPRDFEAVIEKLLSREPGDRYQDGEALARDLQRIADGEPVHIRRLPLHVRVWRRARKNPVLSGAVAAAVVLALSSVTLLSVLRREQVQSLDSRHQNNLVAIANNVGKELGPPWGPQHAMFALCGIEMPAVPPSPPVLAALDRAERELPGDQQVSAMRAAYVGQSLPEVGALLREGRGYEALQILDRQIAEELATRTGGELAIELRLYHLYLDRGIANLTAVVGRLTEARTDLALASFLRPGAAFPLALLRVLKVVDGAQNDVPNAAQELEREIAKASGDRAQVVGHLLWSVAGLRPMPGANLMDLGLSFPERRQLHELALRLLPGPPAGALPGGTPTGWCSVLATEAEGALRELANRGRLRDLAEALRARIDASVHPQSFVQGWHGFLQLLENPSQRGQLVDGAGRVLSPLQQLAAWDALLRLSPDPQTVAVWLPRFEEFRRAHPGLPGMQRTAARLHQVTGSSEAAALTQAWFAEAEGDPEAWLWRMRASLRRGAVEEARDDATIAVQQAVDREGTLQQVIRICDEAAAGLGSGSVEGAHMLAQSFRSLAAGIEGHRGGGR